MVEARVHVMPERHRTRRAIDARGALAILALLALAGPLACSEPARPPARPADAPRAVAAPVVAAPAPRDSTWVDVTGPTLIAFYPSPAAGAPDSAGDVGTALDDFGYYLAEASDSLRALHVRVVSVTGQPLHVVTDGRLTVFRSAPDSAELGYYLVAPGRTAVVLYGAQTDADLLDAARQHLLGPRCRSAAGALPERCRSAAGALPPPQLRAHLEASRATATTPTGTEPHRMAPRQACANTAIPRPTRRSTRCAACAARGPASTAPTPRCWSR